MDEKQIAKVIDHALGEDLPDITTEAIFDQRERTRARFLMKARGVLAGLNVARLVFERLDPLAQFTTMKSDGAQVEAGEWVAEVEATVHAVLAGERTALNLMQRASGIATTTRKYVDAVAGTKAKIYDTRKTAPGLRYLDKYAVKIGGGENHRIGLFDMFLIKNNHIDRAGSITAAVQKVREHGGAHQVMVEVRNLAELEQAAATRPDFILLDNMSLEMLRQCVERIGGEIPLEASGGVNLGTVRAIAETGVDRISVGALTHSVDALDISLRIQF